MSQSQSQIESQQIQALDTTTTTKARAWRAAILRSEDGQGELALTTADQASLTDDELIAAGLADLARATSAEVARAARGRVYVGQWRDGVYR